MGVVVTLGVLVVLLAALLTFLSKPDNRMAVRARTLRIFRTVTMPHYYYSKVSDRRTSTMTMICMRTNKALSGSCGRHSRVRHCSTAISRVLSADGVRDAVTPGQRRGHGSSEPFVGSATGRGRLLVAARLGKVV